MNYIKVFLLLLILDFLWIGLVFKDRFSTMIFNVQGSPMEARINSAIVAYILLFILAVVFLPKLSNIGEAFLLGFCVYGVYDATNYATLKNWNLYLALADSVWGGILFALVYKFGIQN
jgi:uncharacterized membrane protein